MILMAPCCLSAGIFIAIDNLSTVGRKVVVMSMLIVSVLPLIKLLKFEAAYRRLNSKREAEDEINQGDEIDVPEFGSLSFNGSPAPDRKVLNTSDEDIV